MIRLFFEDKRDGQAKPSWWWCNLLRVRTSWIGTLIDVCQRLSL